MDSNKKDLYVPIHVPENQSKDYFQGFGSKELFCSIISLIVAIIVAIVLFITTRQIIISIGLGAGIVALTILFVKRNPQDECFIDYLKIIRKHQKRQKKFLYN